MRRTERRSARRAGRVTVLGVVVHLLVSPPTLPAADSAAPPAGIAEAQIDADGQVERAQVELEATKVALRRAERLLGDKAGAARTVDESRARVAAAEAALRTAQARRDLLGEPVLATRPPAELWIRVPIYVGDRATLRTQETAQVSRSRRHRAVPYAR